MKYQIGLYESPRGALVADHTAMITQLQWATDTGGDKDLTYTALIAPRDAMALFDRRDILHVQVSRGGEVLWQGRVTGAGVSVESATSVRIQALGYRTAMYDTLYTAMWSDIRLSSWTAAKGGSGERMDLYGEISNDTEIGVSMQARRYTTAMRGRWRYVTPSQSSRPILEATVTLEYDIPAGISVRVSYAQAIGGSETIVTNIAGPASGSGVFSSFVVASSAGITVIYAGLVPTTNVTVATTDEFYVRISSPYVQTFDSFLTFLPYAIPLHLISTINALNGGELIASEASLEIMQQLVFALMPTTIEFLDMRPGDVMDQWIAPGDGLVPFEWGVDQRRVLYVRSKEHIQTTWQIEVSTLTLDRVVDPQYNSGYAIQQGVDGTIVRSATVTNASSVQQLGLTRQTSISVQQSSNVLDVVQPVVDNAAMPIPQVAIVPSLVTLLGQIVETYRVRAGDAVQLLSMPFIGVDGLARLRTFRVVETRYDAIADRIEITPESAPPRLQDVVRP